MQENVQETETIELIKQQIANHMVVLYMKGNPDVPQCGYSGKVAKILKQLKVQFAYVDVIKNPYIRLYLPNYANWPTFPQLYINHELIGGCDLVSEMHKDNELQTILEKVGAIADESKYYAT